MIRRRFVFVAPSLLLLFLMTAACFLGGCLDGGSVNPDDLQPGEVMVAATLPGSGELDLGRSLGLRLVQAKSQEDSTIAMDPAAAAQITPEIAGTWLWGPRWGLHFHPDEPYQPNTRYRVTLDDKAFAAAGLKLRGARSFDFMAAPFRLRGLNLERQRVGYDPPRHQVEGLIAFSYPVAPEQLMDHLSADLEGIGSVPLILETTGTSTELHFRSEAFNSDRQDRVFRVTVEGNLAPALGGEPLGEDEDASLTVPALERLQIDSVDLGSDQEKHTITFRFNENVEPEDLRRHLEIEPEVEDLTFTGQWRRVTLGGKFETGRSYTLKLGGGLTAQNGLMLEQDFSRKVTPQDLDPMVRITGPGNYLSLKGEGRVGIETINLDSFELTVQRVFPNNLVPFLQKVRLRDHRNWYYDWELEEQGRTLFTREYKVAPGGPNKLQATPVDLGEVLAKDSRGIFRLLVRPDDESQNQDGRWLVATDLGLVAKRSEDRVEVAVASISELTPVSGVLVRVLSRNNQELASARTDDQGLARFRGLDPGDPGSRPFVVVATRGDDLSFLAFDETAIPIADYDVGGVDLPEKGYRAFLYGDRDIYRPGETLHLVWMVRDADLQPAPDMPLNLKILGPGGEEFATTRAVCDAAGCGEFETPIPRWVQTGHYTALLFLGDDRLLGETRYSVEDFMPDRMKVTTTLLADGTAPTVVGPDAKLTLSAEAMSLFGPAAAGRQAEASVWFRHTPVRLPGYEEFHFGTGGHEELPPRRKLGTIRTDDQGRADWGVPLPSAPHFQGWLRLTALVQVTELGGGRAVSSTVETDFAPVDRVLGVRNLEVGGSDYREPGQPVRFEAVLLDLAGQPLADHGASVRLLRRHWRTVLKRNGEGRYIYVSEYDEKQVAETALTLGAGPTPLEVTPTSHGSYRLEVVSGDGVARGSVDFYVYGFGYSPWAMSNPEKVNLKLDRESYPDGGLVTASVEAPFPGLMLVTLEREKVLSRQWVRLQENTGTVKVRLPEGAAPNVYLTATLLRPLDELDPRAPARAFGAQPVFVDRTRRTLPVEMVTVEAMRPRQPLKVRVKLPPDPAPMRLTVAAVDEGILQLTDYATPSALDHFLARRRLGVSSFDIWSLLLPEFERVKRKSAAGGGMERAMAAAPEQAKRLNPLAADRVKPVALWTGLLEGEPGWQEISLDVPQFNGSLRVMAVATAGDRFGGAESRVRVADPLVLSPSLPRFLAPGDQFAVPVPVYNALEGTTGEAVDLTVGLQLTGPIEAPPGATLSRTLPIVPGKEDVAWFDLQAGGRMGVAEITCDARGGGESVSVTTELPVRPPNALETRVTGGSLRAQEVQTELKADWLPGTSLTTVTVAANPAAAYGAALPYLLRYPYGCLEQKTSRCFPLLHFGALAASLAPGQFGEHDGDYFINSGLDYLATLYRQGTGFVMWPGGGYENRNPFATVYATHFLVEARRAGYVVPETVYSDALRVIAAYARSSRDGWPERWTDPHRLTTRAYASYVLAMAGAPERGAMDQMLQDEWRKLSAASRTHLAGAYALTGNRARFEELLPAADAPVDGGRATGFTWFSVARDEAMRLEVLATVDPDHIQVPRLMQRLAERAENGRWYTTQENAFALLALGKLAEGGRLQPASGKVLVDGREVGAFAGEDFSIQSREWSGRTITIRAEGEGTAWYSVRDEGIPATPAFTELDAGLAVRREYFDTEGNPVDLLAIGQGQTLVCRLLLQSEKGPVEDIVLSDLVPAGLEIENPRLSRDGGYDWVREDARHYRPLGVDHLEVRDDRLLLFTRADERVAAFHYTLRAVTAGHFTLPAVRAEAMYDPEVMSTRGGGEIRVERP